MCGRLASSRVFSFPLHCFRVLVLVVSLSAGGVRLDRQHFFVNHRPVDLPKISRVVNEVYRYAPLDCGVATTL